MKNIKIGNEYRNEYRNGQRNGYRKEGLKRAATIWLSLMMTGLMYVPAFAEEINPEVMTEGQNQAAAETETAAAAVLQEQGQGEPGNTVISFTVSGEWNKYEPNNELIIPMEKTGGMIIGGKMTANNPFDIWTEQPLTDEEKIKVTESLKNEPGVGNPKKIEFLSGSENGAYGLTVNKDAGTVTMDHPSSWALLYGGQYVRTEVTIKEEPAQEQEEVNKQGETQEEVKEQNPAPENNTGDNVLAPGDKTEDTPAPSPVVQEEKDEPQTPPENNGGKVLPPENNGGKVLPPENNDGKVLPPENNGGRVLPPGRTGGNVLPPAKIDPKDQPSVEIAEKVLTSAGTDEKLLTSPKTGEKLLTSAGKNEKNSTSENPAKPVRVLDRQPKTGIDTGMWKYVWVLGLSLMGMMISIFLLFREERSNK